MGTAVSPYVHEVQAMAPSSYVQRVGPHIGHRQHLCDLVDRGDATLAEFKDLVRDSKFLCKVCGRAAAREENLCDPVPLDYRCAACGMTFETRTELMEHNKKMHNM